MAATARSWPAISGHGVRIARVADTGVGGRGQVAQTVGIADDGGDVVVASRASDTTQRPTPPEGLALIDRALPRHLETETRLLAALTATERDALAGTLRKLLQSLGDHAGGGVFPVA